MIGLPVLLLAVSAILSVAAVAVSLFAVWRSQALVILVDARARAGLQQAEVATQALRKAVDAVAAELRDLPQLPAAAASLPAAPRAGLNLSKRSQVLRMHRKGDTPDRIAAALEVPLQEVDLLIKVHRIVINRL